MPLFCCICFSQCLLSYNVTYMLFTVIADTRDPDFSLKHGVFKRFPAGQTRFFASIWTVQQEQINISQSTLFHRIRDTLSHSLIAPLITRQLACVVNILSLDLRVFFQVRQNGGAYFALIVVHLRTVKGTVAGFEGIADRIAGFAAGCEVDSKVDMGD